MREVEVSVIMIFLNAGRFIEEAIESVFRQTYTNWELLLVDDGSTDSSTEIAQRTAAMHPDRVRYLEHEGHVNLGMSAARNLGMSHARGTYITFLDADDTWFPQALEKQVAILELHPEAGMVYGPILRWYSWAGDPEDGQQDNIEELGFQPNTLIRPPALLAHFLRHEGAKPSGFMVRREVAARTGGYEETFRGMYEDQAFCAKVCLSEAVFVSGDCWYRYRKHPDSCCSVTVNSGGYRQARLAFLNWLKGYLSDQQFQDRELQLSLREEMWRTSHPGSYRLWQRAYPLARKVKMLALPVARRLLPARRQNQLYSPPVGQMSFGSLRRLSPVSRRWGYDRGLPIDRYYIERFLAAHAGDIHGRVLEIGDDTYTRQFGAGRVSSSDVLNVMAGRPRTTIVADLTSDNHIPNGVFDCVIFTQTLPFIYDLRAALCTLYRILAPCGVILATFPGISKVSRSDMERWGHYWAFTTLSAKRLFEEAFPMDEIEVDSYGNVLSASSFLYGLAAQELQKKELDHRDPDYQVLISVRAVKPESVR